MFPRLILSLAVATLGAQSITEDAEGCKDPKLLSRLPGCFIQSCESKEFDQVTIRPLCGGRCEL